MLYHDAVNYYFYRCAFTKFARAIIVLDQRNIDYFHAVRALIAPPTLRRAPDEAPQ